jgi:hypothetical protein
MKETNLDELRDRLLRRIVINNNGCWEWQGAINNHGYGVIKVTNLSGNGEIRTFYVHRMSYLCHKGNLCSDKLVCHKCDNPICINPDHLFLGTNKDNMDDMQNKNRKVVNSDVHYGNNYAGKMVLANGVVYKSYTEAGKALGISGNSVKKRIKNGLSGYKQL